jgi:ditrans,polycis-polyprenyl diphosphate synthase
MIHFMGTPLNLNTMLVQIGNFGCQFLWCILHFIVRIWYFLLEIVHEVESYLISSGLMKSYKAFNLGKLRYLAIVVGSEEACQTSKVIELLQWLEAIGVKHVCLYDMEGEDVWVQMRWKLLYNCSVVM